MTGPQSPTKYTYKSYLKEVKEAINQMEIAALEAVGAQISSICADNISLSTKKITGNLVGSPFHIVKPEKKAVWVGSDVHYFIYQHEGTSNGVKPKKFLTNAVFDNIQLIKEILADYMS